MHRNYDFEGKSFTFANSGGVITKELVLQQDGMIAGARNANETFSWRVENGFLQFLNSQDVVSVTFFQCAIDIRGGLTLWGPSMGHGGVGQGDWQQFLIENVKVEQTSDMYLFLLNTFMDKSFVYAKSSGIVCRELTLLPNGTASADAMFSSSMYWRVSEGFLQLLDGSNEIMVTFLQCAVDMSGGLSLWGPHQGQGANWIGFGGPGRGDSQHFLIEATTKGDKKWSDALQFSKYINISAWSLSSARTAPSVVSSTQQQEEQRARACPASASIFNSLKGRTFKYGSSGGMLLDRDIILAPNGTVAGGNSSCRFWQVQEGLLQLLNGACEPTVTFLSSAFDSTGGLTLWGPKLTRGGDVGDGKWQYFLVECVRENPDDVVLK